LQGRADAKQFRQVSVAARQGGNLLLAACVGVSLLKKGDYRKNRFQFGLKRPPQCCLCVLAKNNDSTYLAEVGFFLDFG